MSEPLDLEGYKKCRENRKDLPNYCDGNMCCFLLVAELAALRAENERLREFVNSVNKARDECILLLEFHKWVCKSLDALSASAGEPEEKPQ